MATTHDANCRCGQCRAMRAVGQAPQPGRPTEPFMAPATPEKEIDDDVQKAIQDDPVGTVVSLIIDDVDRTEILRILSLCGIEGDKASDIIKEAEKVHAEGGDTFVAERRKRGYWLIVQGIALALFAIFAVETVMWLIIGNFGSFGIIDAIFVLVGLSMVARGLYRVVTAKRPSRTSDE